MVAFGVAEAEEAFFEDGILPVPEGYSEAEVLEEVGDAPEAVLAPEIGSAVCLVIGELMSGIAIGAIIFSNCSPLSCAQIRSPLF